MPIDNFPETKNQKDPKKPKNPKKTKKPKKKPKKPMPNLRFKGSVWFFLGLLPPKIWKLPPGTNMTFLYLGHQSAHSTTLCN